MVITETTGELEVIMIRRRKKQEATVSADYPFKSLALKAKGGEEERRRYVG